MNLFILIYFILKVKYNDASIKQTNISLTYTRPRPIDIIGYKFTLVIPINGFIIDSLPGWIGILSKNSTYYIYGFKIGDLDDIGKCIIALIYGENATIFYINT